MNPAFVSAPMVALFCSGRTQLPTTAIANATLSHDHAIVVDIDGTLTPSVLFIWKAREHASRALNIFAEKGYEIIYLSTRISLFSAGIPGWLKSEGFPDGSIHVAQTREDHSLPELYKTRMLREFIAKGWVLQGAYGDSSADFVAYSAVHIPKGHVYALKREGNAACQPGEWVACLSGWTEHLEFIESVQSVHGR